MAKKRTLILLRHAHRDTGLGRDRDNGLSEKGNEQARAFRDYFLKSYDAKPFLLSSPKKRCRQSLEPLADKIASPPEVDKLLDEQSDTESFDALERRVEIFQTWMEETQHPLVIACSHGDWIPIFADKAISQPLSLKKGAWFTFEINSKKKWKLISSH